MPFDQGVHFKLSTTREIAENKYFLLIIFDIKIYCIIGDGALPIPLSSPSMSTPWLRCAHRHQEVVCSSPAQPGVCLSAAGIPHYPVVFAMLLRLAALDVIVARC